MFLFSLCFRLYFFSRVVIWLCPKVHIPTWYIHNHFFNKISTFLIFYTNWLQVTFFLLHRTLSLKLKTDHVQHASSFWLSKYLHKFFLKKKRLNFLFGAHVFLRLQHLLINPLWWKHVDFWTKNRYCSMRFNRFHPIVDIICCFGACSTVLEFWIVPSYLAVWFFAHKVFVWDFFCIHL